MLEIGCVVGESNILASHCCYKAAKVMHRGLYTVLFCFILFTDSAFFVISLFYLLLQQLNSSAYQGPDWPRF